MRSVRAAAHDIFRSLRYRNFRLFFTGQLVSQVGNWMTLVAQTLFVLKITDSGIALGVLAAAQFGPILILGPWAGLVADRSDQAGRRLDDALSAAVETVGALPDSVTDTLAVPDDLAAASEAAAELKVVVSTEVASMPVVSGSTFGGDIESLPRPGAAPGEPGFLLASDMPAYLKDFFAAQGVNPLIDLKLDDWLSVGHVDEGVPCRGVLHSQRLATFGVTPLPADEQLGGD